VRKAKTRRGATRRAVRELLEKLISRDLDVYRGYRRLYGYWCRNNSAVQELRPFFCIPGIEPDGRLSVDEDFKLQILSLAKTIAPRFERDTPDSH
jgi:hypothetical protein